MIIKDGLIIKQIDNEYILIDSGVVPPIFNGIVKLNETSKTIIELLKEREYSYGELVNALLNIYDVDETSLKAAIDPFLYELRKINLLNG